METAKKLLELLRISNYTQQDIEIINVLIDTEEQKFKRIIDKINNMWYENDYFTNVVPQIRELLKNKVENYLCSPK